MPVRRLPVRPDLDHLKHEAKDLLRAIRRREPAALTDLAAFHPAPPPPDIAKLADAQLALARSYQAPSWPRLVRACRLIDAIWRDDVETVRELVVRHPNLLREHAGIRNSNWGPPLSYAANLGRDRIITMLHELGATDLEHAVGRAVLQGRIETARMLHRLLGSPRPRDGALDGPAYTLSVSGTALLFDWGARVRGDGGRLVAPVAVVLETDSRNPAAKHAILALYQEHGVVFPDTPPMALHRGRIDLLEEHLRHDPDLLTRTFSIEEICPPELGCGPEALPRTSIAGATLLHLAVEYAEEEIVRWLLARGTPVDVRSALDADGFGGHTALFAAVVSYPNFWINYAGRAEDGRFARLLLAHGADPTARASLRELVMDNADVLGTREHRDLTPLEWGRCFHNPLIVSRAAMAMLEGGRGSLPPENLGRQSGGQAENEN